MMSQNSCKTVFKEGRNRREILNSAWDGMRNVN